MMFLALLFIIPAILLALWFGFHLIAMHGVPKWIQESRYVQIGIYPLNKQDLAKLDIYQRERLDMHLGESLFSGGVITMFIGLAAGMLRMGLSHHAVYVFIAQTAVAVLFAIKLHKAAIKMKHEINFPAASGGVLEKGKERPKGRGIRPG